jgi:hypothetical protein
MKHLNFKLIINKTGIVAICHLLFAIAAYYFLYKLGYKQDIPNNLNILKYDAVWYDNIMDIGYNYQPGVGNELAFFPLFPLVWYVSLLTPVGISIFNCLFFLTAFIYLLKEEKLPVSILLMLLSFPSFIFFALPYSESLFFLFCTFIILGYQKDNNKLLYIGLLGASMARSVCMLFIPAIIICELFNTNSHESKKQRIINCAFKIFATTAGFLIASAYMAYASGKWFYFIEIQKYWFRHWIVPHFPLTTFYPNRVLGLDAITFVLGILALWICIKCTIYVVKKNKLTLSNSIYINQAVLFSALYLAGMTILDTGFTRYVDNATAIWSINRHMMCTPFAITFLVYLFRDFHPQRKELTGVILVLILSIYITGVYQYLVLPVLGFFVLFFVTLFGLKYYPVLNRFFIIYYLIAILLQIKFYEEFFTGLWLG